MAYDDIDIPMRSVRDLEQALTDTIAELEDAPGNSEAVKSAVTVQMPLVETATVPARVPVPAGASEAVCRKAVA